MIPQDLMRKYKYGYVHSCELLNEPFVKEVLDVNSAYTKENQQLKEQVEHLDIVNCQLRKNIEKIKSENQQLKIQISAREEEYRKLEDNWNKLKDYIVNEYYMFLPLEANTNAITTLINKMKELERGVSDE